MHGHQDMEIISYILDGALEHKDSLGTGSVMSAHDVQIMSAGAGIRHSEFNPSSSADVHFLQIWIRPNQRGLAPSYAQKTFPPTLKQGRLCLIASPDQRDDSLLIHSPCDVYASVLRSGDQLHHQLNITHKAWVQIAAGSVRVNDITLNEGDGLAIENESALTITGIAAHADIIVFDMAELTS
jgi:redox-sensitive bicupin YhaK (pirin superfamily)